MNPEQGSLMRVAAHSASTLKTSFSTQRSVPGFKLINNNAAFQKGCYPGAAAGAGNVPAIWS